MSKRKTKPAQASFLVQQQTEFPLPLAFNAEQLRDFSRKAPVTKKTDLPKGVTCREDGGYRVRISYNKSQRLLDQTYPATEAGFFMACEVARIGYVMLDGFKQVQLQRLKEANSHFS